MYSIVLMAALTSAPEAPDTCRCRCSCGCCGCSCSCGCWGGGCHCRARCHCRCSGYCCSCSGYCCCSSGCCGGVYAPYYGPGPGGMPPGKMGEPIPPPKKGT